MRELRNLALAGNTAIMVAQPSPPRTVLVTRPRARAESFVRDLPSGWNAIVAPVMEIAIGDARPDLSGITDLIFTSSHGVEAFAAMFSPVPPLRAVCVGEKTTGKAQGIGLDAEFGGQDAATLCDRFCAAAPDPGRCYLHLRGTHSRGEIAVRLRSAGHAVREAVIYDQVACPLSNQVKDALSAGKFDAVTLFSPRSAELFYGQVGSVPQETAMVCLSPAIAEVAARAGSARILTADKPTGMSMVEQLKALEPR